MDFTQALLTHQSFDTVSQQCLGRIMSIFGSTMKFTQNICQFPEDIMTRVSDSGESFKAFLVIKGIKQSYILNPQCSA